MKTKFLSLCFVLFCAAQLFAYDYECNGIYYNLNRGDKTAVVTRCFESDYSGSIVIPSTISRFFTSYTVIAIGEDAFIDCKKLKSITIPNSVTEIGRGAFCGCTGLTSIVIPSSVTEIKDAAFWKCTSLTFITIPNSVTKVGAKAFAWSGLTSIVIPISVTEIGDFTFSDCTNLTSIKIPNSVKSIGTGAFWNCIRLASIDIPNSVKKIESDAFKGCYSLISIKMPNSITEIAPRTFYDCRSLTSITIPNSVKVIGNLAFAGCEYLEKIDLGSGIKDIGSCAFYGDFRLEEIGIGSATTPNIRYDTFYGINKKFAIYVPGNVRDKYWTDPHWDGLKILIDEPGRNAYAVIQSAWIDQYVSFNGKKGMRIHVKFNAYDVYNHKISVYAYFYEENGKALAGVPFSDYTTEDFGGIATVHASSTAIYANSIWNDFDLFMPYSYLQLPIGHTNLNMEAHIGVYDITTRRWLTKSLEVVSFKAPKELQRSFFNL